MIPNDLRPLLAEHLTRNQAIVFELHHQSGMSFRAIAIHLDLARTTVTDRYDAACRTLRRHGVIFDAAGNPLLEVTITPTWQTDQSILTSEELT